MNIIPNAGVSITRQDVPTYDYLRVQINWYAGDPASGGIRGDMHGTLTAPPNTDLREGDIVTVLSLAGSATLPPITRYTLGVAQVIAWPGARVVAPLLGGTRHGGRRA